MRGHRRVVVLSIVLVLLGGCSGIPDSSDVARADGSRSEEQLLMRIDPPAPTPDATPVEVVRGFVDAMRAFPVSTDTAAEYLTEDAVTDWRPQRQTVVYDELSATETPDSVVKLSVRRIATIDARGTFKPRTGSLLDPDQSLRVER